MGSKFSRGNGNKGLSQAKGMPEYVVCEDFPEAMIEGKS